MVKLSVVIVFFVVLLVGWRRGSGKCTPDAFFDLYFVYTVTYKDIGRLMYEGSDFTCIELVAFLDLPLVMLRLFI